MSAATWDEGKAQQERIIAAKPDWGVAAWDLAYDQLKIDRRAAADRGGQPDKLDRLDGRIAAMAAHLLSIHGQEETAALREHRAARPQEAS